MAEKEPKEQDVVITKTLRIAWPNDIPAAYANNVVAQNDGKMLVLSFFQVNPPYIIAESDEVREKMVEEMESIHALPIAKVAIPWSVVPALLKLLRGHMETTGETGGATNGNDSD